MTDPPHHPSSHESGPTRTECSVLIVDDDEALRSIVAALLRDEGFEVLEAPDGRAGVAAATGAARPDVILLDYRMPGLDGGEVYDRLRAAGLGDAVVLVTAARASSEIAARHGIPFILDKPFSIDELLDAVERAMHASSGS